MWDAEIGEYYLSVHLEIVTAVAVFVVIFITLQNQSAP